MSCHKLHTLAKQQETKKLLVDIIHGAMRFVMIDIAFIQFEPGCFIMKKTWNTFKNVFLWFGPFCAQNPGVVGWYVINDLKKKYCVYVWKVKIC